MNRKATFRQLISWLQEAWSSRTELTHYAVAVLATLTAFSLTLWLNKFIPQPVVFLFFAAVGISAWLGGIKPGILATVLSALLCDYFFIPPLHTFAIVNVAERITLSEFFLSGLILCLTLEQLRSTHRSLIQTNKRLEQEVQERIERERSLQRYTQALSELANHPAIAKGNLDSALNVITELAAHALNIERVSVWLFDDEHTKLRCINLYERSQDRHSSGFERNQVTHPTYFQALATSRTIAVADTRTDPRVQEYWATWLAPKQIVSLIDAPIRVGGEIVGMVFHEQVKTPRKWELLDETFVGSIADFVALALEVSERKQAETALQASEAEFLALFTAIPDPLFVIDATGLILNATQVEVEKLYKPVNEQVGPKYRTKSVKPPEILPSSRPS
jgi:K+-sensing histidine kinase KdpD